MSRTIEEIIEYLVEFYDPDLVIEILEITTEELCDRFDDKLEVAIDKGTFNEDRR